VTEWLESHLIGAGWRLALLTFLKKSVCSPRRNGYQAPIRAREGEGGEEKEWHLIPGTRLPVQVGSLTALPKTGH